MKIKEIKIREDDGSYSDPIPVGADSLNVDYENTNVKNELDKLNSENSINKQDINNLKTALNATKDNLNVQTSRIDNLAHLEEGSTTGDAELIDIRIGEDGTIYRNAGTAVRTQIGNINEYLDVILEKVESVNKMNFEAFQNGYYNTTSGTGVWTESDQYSTSDFIKVKTNETVYFYLFNKNGSQVSGAGFAYWYFFDENGNYVGRQNGGSSYAPSANGYIRCMHNMSTHTDYITKNRNSVVTTSSTPINEKYFKPYLKLKESVVEKTVKNIKPLTISKTGNEIVIKTKKARYIFKKVTNTSINIDTWRLYQGDIIDDDNSYFNMWENTDAEGAIKITGEDDFVCGFHGDEIYTNVRFFADGKEILENENFNETMFNKFVIYVESNVYHCNTSQLASELAFKRNKKIIFDGNKVKVSNHFVAQSDLSIYQARIALFQCYKTNSDGVQKFSSYSVNTDQKCYDVVLEGTATKPSANVNLKEVDIHTDYAEIHFKYLNGSNQNYKGSVVDFTSQNRMKYYLDTIYNTISVSAGEVIASEFEWSID